MNVTPISLASASWTDDWPTILLASVAVVVAVVGPYLADWFRKLFVRPRIRVEFLREYGFWHRTVTKYSRDQQLLGEHPCYYFRFSVRNQGKALARSCEIVLDSIEAMNDGGNYEPLEGFWPTKLNFEGGTAETTGMDINPRRPQLFVDIGHICHPEAQTLYERSQCARIDPTDPRLRFILGLATKHFAKIDSLFPGRYRLHVVVVGENFHPVWKQIELYWSGNWRDTEEEMLGKEITLEMFPCER